jgi:hypothetical protein
MTLGFPTRKPGFFYESGTQERRKGLSAATTPIRGARASRAGGGARRNELSPRTAARSTNRDFRSPIMLDEEMFAFKYERSYDSR